MRSIADRSDAPEALGARRRRQRRAQPVTAAAERDVRRVDRKSQYVENDLTRAGVADSRCIDAIRDLFRGAISGDLNLLHSTFPIPCL
jgi:hypothetical protein